MEKFDLVAALCGAQVCTGDGRPARILCHNLRHPLYPIVAAVADETGAEVLRTYRVDGTHMDGHVASENLMLANDDYRRELERAGSVSTDVIPAGKVSLISFSALLRALTWRDPRVIVPDTDEEVIVMEQSDKTIYGIMRYRDGAWCRYHHGWCRWLLEDPPIAWHPIIPDVRTVLLSSLV